MPLSSEIQRISICVGICVALLSMSLESRPRRTAAQATATLEIIVSNTNDSGAGSFRNAVAQANASPGLDLIKFSIGTGVQRILIGPLGRIEITDSVEIDGASQPGSGTSPRIELSKNYVAADGGGTIRLMAGSCRIHGLRFVNFIQSSPDLYVIALEVQSDNNLIYGNVFGSEQGLDEPNDTAVEVTGNNNTIGGDGASDTNIFRKNYRGIHLSATNRNTIKGNLIVQNNLGLTDPGSFYSAGITTANDNGPQSNDGLQIVGNVISGAGDEGYGIKLSGTTNALIQNNKIGVDATGLVALSQFEGIQISGGSTNRIIGNVISGNTTAIGAGAGIVSSSIGTRIENNLIGLGIDGVTVIPNATGIILGGQGGIIGGENSGIVTVGNFVTGNLNDQVRLEIGPGGFGIIQGNTLGLDRLGGGSSGTKTGTGSGVGGTTSSGGVKVGGATPGARNVISGNDGDGIQLGVINLGTGVSNVEIVNNYIGTDANGNDANVGNAGNGVYIGSLADLISIHDNRIAYNGLRGVQIPTSSVPAESGFSVEISRNEVFSNGRIVLPDNGMNVDLGILGPTPNDLGDADVGGNGLQNYPLISSATTSGGLVTISGQFNSLPNNRYRLEFFYSANCVNNIPNTISQFLSATYAYTGGTAASVTPFSVQFTIPNGFPVSAQIQSVAINSPLLKTRYRPTALIKQNLPEVENTSEYSPCFTSN